MRYGSIVLGVIAILALLAPAVVLSDDSSAAACDDIKVYIEEADGSYEMSVVNGVTTVKGLIEGKQVIKVIAVPGKLLNIVVK